MARALVNGAQLLLADEPTGNLDAKTGEMVLEIILELHRKRGLSSIIVTHNERIAGRCHRVFVMEAGALKPIPSPSVRITVPSPVPWSRPMDRQDADMV